MPKRLSEAYVDDDGFVEDAAPAANNKSSKKQKTSPSNITGAGGGGGGGGSSASLPGGGHIGQDGGEFWEISGKRRLQLSTFNGQQMVSIREYYEKGGGGGMLPGKKGISLTIEQFDIVIGLLPAVEEVLKGKGCVVGRPDYEGLGDGDGVEGGEDGEEEEEDGEGEEKGGRGRKDRVGKKKGKKNFEETSEDE